MRLCQKEIPEPRSFDQGILCVAITRCNTTDEVRQLTNEVVSMGCLLDRSKEETAIAITSLSRL